MLHTKHLFLLALLTITACTQKEQQSDEIANQEIESTLAAMWAAIEAKDIQKYAEYIHPDFTQFGEYDSALRVGKEAEVAGIRDWINRSENIHTEMVDPHVKINGNVAWIVYYWKDYGVTDGEKFSTYGKSTRIFVRENGKWLCIHGHYTLLDNNLTPQ